MTDRPTVERDETSQLTARVVVRVTPAERDALTGVAGDVGLSQQRFMRGLVQAAIGTPTAAGAVDE